MTLTTGDRAPDFTLPDQSGQPLALRDLLAKGPVVVFFYPAAATAGCTVQACHFRDLAAEFEELGAQVVGISRDAVDKQAAWTQKRGFGYPLLSDTDRSVAEAFGVKGGMLGLSPVKRSTFVIGEDGVILATYASETNMNAHADRALDALRARSA
jgi:peroxiredoxin Q/BCP